MTNPGFNAAAWAGTKPLVKPMPAPIDVGSTVWETAPEDGDYDPRGGLVVARTVNDEGEPVYSVLRARMDGGHFRCWLTTLGAAEINRETVQPPDHARLHRAARQLCRHLGERQGGYVTGRDRDFLDLAVSLVRIAAAMATTDRKEG